ncbi:AAA family ATPase [Roseburia inulinivorans]
MKALNIPVGISNFEKIRNNGFYYVDKTGLIEELLKTEAEVTLITRPRRFGKTLGMSMLESFFDIRKNSRKLFEGLEIARQSELCSKWMNQYPTVSVSFRQVDGLNFTSAYDMLTMVFADLYNKHLYLLEDSHVTEFQKKTFTNIAHGCGSEKEVKSSLVLLTTMMQQHYGKAVVLLIDEYDVPVAKANAHGYYNEMLDVMKGLLQALKDNQALCFAVVTGCLKIAKESIFTGTNNFVSDTITDSRLNEYFGFVQSEVDQILADAETEDQAENIRKWYDGYHFGDFDVYCPWDVMNYLLELQHNPQAKPVSYWKNTSDNAIIRSFIDHSGSSITKKLENLMAGETIVQRVDENLTYDYLHSSEDNLWSMLYLTGYLTKARNEQTDEVLPDGAIALMIPNEEIRDIFETTVIQWFDDSTRKWNRTVLFDAVWNGDSVNLTKEMNILLRRTISYHDYKEDFYHAFLAGIFTGAGYMVDSNKEHGEGRSDVVVYDPVNGRVAIFEAKYTKNQEKLESTCNTALQQIDERLYAKEYEDDYDQILCYGISFFKKRCLVKKK